MGAFVQKPSAYTPKLDSNESNPTLVSGGLDPTPADNPDEWRIELRRLPILHRGHAVLVLQGPNGELEELNGLAKSRNTGRTTRFRIGRNAALRRRRAALRGGCRAGGGHGGRLA